MDITATEFKKNFGYYLALAEREDIIITKNGRPYRILSDYNKTRKDLVSELCGVLPSEMSLEESREERRKNL